MIPYRGLLLSNIFLLFFLSFIKCELFLQINQIKNDSEKNIKETVVELFGSNITLKCEIVNDIQNETYDDHLLWVKNEGSLRFKNENDLRFLAKHSRKLYQYIKNGEINRAVLHFDNFSKKHEGLYACISLKYMLFKVVELKEDDFEKSIIQLLGSMEGYPVDKPQRTFRFCNQNMFTCVLSTACINYHYVCDGKKDCSDGSDETPLQCNGDPCAGKIPCEDGRCIPTYWCCDIRFESNCTVKIRPSCCPPLIEPIGYEEQMKKHASVKSNSTRYLFITICLISTFLSVLLLILILSKICGFASKYSYDMNSRGIMFGLSRQRPILVDGTIVARHSRRQPRGECHHTECAIRREFLRSYSCSYRPNMSGTSPQRHDVDRQNDVLDPLLNRDSAYGDFVHIIESDQPPSYAEAVKNCCSVGGPSISPSYNVDQGSHLKEFRSSSDPRYSSVNTSSTPPPPYCSTEALQDSNMEGSNGNSNRNRDI